MTQPNDDMQRTALRTASDAGRWADVRYQSCISKNYGLYKLMIL